MASTYSNLKFQLMATGENSGTWGNVTNVNLGTAIEQALVETATVSVSGGDATLTLSDTNARQDARALRLNVTGASVARVVNVPAIEKPYLVNNAGTATVTVKVSGQTGIAVPAGKTMWVYNNGTDVVDALTHLTSLTLGTDLAVTEGGTGASDASTARTNLGLGIGTNVQAYDADLTAIGALAKTDGNFIVGNGSTWVAESGSTARTSLGLGSLATLSTINNGNWSGTDLAVANGGTGASDAATARTNLGLAIGTNVQAYDADLTALGGLAKTDGNFIVGNGSTWVAESGSTARTSLGLGSLATASTISNDNWSGTDLSVANGGTGASTLTANNVLLGNGTSAVQFVAPGSSGNVLTSNGTTWTSAAASGGFDSGTVMLFAQTSAPTGWTKNTSTGNNHALRVVTGTASTGGSVDFTTAFASQTPTGSVTITSVSGSAGSTTLSTPQIPSHGHSLRTTGVSVPYPSGSAYVNGDLGYETAANPRTWSSSVQPAGGGGSHSHPFSFSSGSGTFSGDAINLAVKYVDVIRATKD